LQVTFKSFRKEAAVQQGQKTCLDLHQLRVPLSQLVREFLVAFPEYIKHEFHKRWQKTSFDECMFTLKGSEIATCADFSEKWKVQVRLHHGMNCLNIVSLFNAIEFHFNLDCTSNIMWHCRSMITKSRACTMSPSRARFSLSSGHILGRGWMTVQQMVLNLFTKHMYSGQFSSVYESVGLSYFGARFPPWYLICHYVVLQLAFTSLFARILPVRCLECRSDSKTQDAIFVDVAYR